MKPKVTQLELDYYEIMTALGEVMDDPREPVRKEKSKLKFPRMSKEMNEFYELHS